MRVRAAVIAGAIPGGRLVVFGSQVVTKDGIGNRHGTLAWTDATGKVESALEVPQADEIFGMALPASSGAIALVHARNGRLASPARRRRRAAVARLHGALGRGLRRGVCAER
jgi:hypothetical protein